MRTGAAEAILEDGGKPASRPDFVYTGSCLASRGVQAHTCVASVFLKGFRRAVVPVNSSGKTTVILRRLGAEGEVFSKQLVNVGALRMPPAAHRAYAKGEAAMGLGNLANAERWFRIAVKEDPGHALAWDELGLVLEQLGKPEEARSCYRRSIEADPRLPRPLVHMAGLAITAHKWNEAAALTGQALALEPANFPRAWFYDAFAAFMLGRFDQTEVSARKAIDLDPEHPFPAAEYLLGMTLAAKGDSGGGSEHLRAYLKLAPRGRFAEPARLRLNELDAAAAR